MDFIMIPLVTGIVTLGIYKFFELLICRRERRELISRLEGEQLIDYLKLVPMGLRNRAGYSGGSAEDRQPAAGAGTWTAVRFHADPSGRSSLL